MLSSLHSALRRRSVLLASGTAVLLAVGGGATAAVAASGPAPTASASTTSCQPRLGALLRGAAPKQLRADLKALRAEPKDQRAADREAIRQKMLTGAYGARVERLAHLAGGKAAGKGWAASLPAALRTDLKVLRGLTAKSAERKAAAEKIAAKALAGGYGTEVQTRAKAVQERVAKRCAAQG